MLGTLHNGRRQIRRAAAFSLVQAGLWLSPAAAHAHVKWFSRVDWSTPPRSVSDLTRSGNFWLFLALALLALLACVALDSRLANLSWMRRLTAWFQSKSAASLLVMRVGAFAALLLAWRDGTLFAPDLVVNNAAIERLQLALVVLLFWKPTTSLAGAGLAAIWIYGAARFGLLHLLDYLNVLGAAYFLTVRPLASPLIRATALPALYATLGFSLVWLGCEKLIYPQWSLYLLDQNPLLTLGLAPEFFLTSAAFIELALGFMLMIGLFERPVSIVATLLFFATSLVFGKLEIIGHTLIHAALIVFLLEGPGRFTPPAAFHRTQGMRMAFAGVNFVVLVAASLAVYSYAAARVEHAVAQQEAHPAYEVPPGEARPTIELEVTRDAKSGWNVRIVTTNFHFAPEKAGLAHVPGEGHVHIEVDGRHAARVYSEWHHLPPQELGEHTILATLVTNDHRAYAVAAQPIAASAAVLQE
jgi:hypothetical protein